VKSALFSISRKAKAPRIKRLEENFKLLEENLPTLM